MSTVHYLKQPVPDLDAYAEMQRHRTRLIGAWTAWLATNPPQHDVEQEIIGTECAMRSLAALLDRANGRCG
jgi:hypothetical protein